MTEPLILARADVVRVDHCRAESCGELIVLVRTPKGRAIPLDPEPVPEGNIVLNAKGEATVRTRDSLLDQNVERYQTHFATCPEAQRFRKRRGA